MLELQVGRYQTSLFFCDDECVDVNLLVAGAFEFSIDEQEVVSHQK